MVKRSIAIGALASILAIPGAADEKKGCFQIPGTTTYLKFYGIARLDAALTLRGGTADPLSDSLTLDGAAPKNQWQMTARQSIIGLTSTTPSDFGDVNVRFEGDWFSTSDNTSTGTPVFRLRLAYLEVGNFLAGQQWSLLKDQRAKVDCIENSGTIGPFYSVGRVPQVRYTQPLGKHSSFALALEQDQTPKYSNMYTDAGGTTHSLTTTKSSAFPGTVTGAYSLVGEWGHVNLAAVVQRYAAWTAQQSVTVSGGGTHVVPEATCSTTAASFQASGNYVIGKDNLVAAVLYGRAPGPCGTIMGDGAFLTGDNQFTCPTETAWHLGYTRNWNKTVRSNLAYAHSALKYNRAIDGPESTSKVMKNASEYLVNTFVKVTRNSEVGLEYTYIYGKPFGNNSWVQPDGTHTDKKTQSRVALMFRAFLF
jgi:hypothetical protein